MIIRKILFIKVLILGVNMPKFALPEIANLQLIWLRRRPAESCDGDMTQLHLRMTTGTRALLENFLTTVIQVLSIHIYVIVRRDSISKSIYVDNIKSITFLSYQLCLKWTCPIRSRFEMVHTVARNTSFYNCISIGDQKIHRAPSIQLMVQGI